jgi:hypothetical protein
VIEIGIIQDTSLKNKIDIKKVRPPYGSSFPTRIPSLGYLKRKYPKTSNKKSKKEEYRKDYGAIWYSLMYNNEGGIADFGNYVVNSTLSHWCNLKLSKDGSRGKTIKEMDMEFVKNLDRKQKAYWKKLANMRRNLGWQSTLLGFPIKEAEGLEVPKSKFTKEQVQEAERYVQKLEKDFIKELDNKQQRLYKKGVLAFRKNPSGSDDLDNAEIQRVIFSRVATLGWTPKLFAKYDSSVRDSNRDSHKSERIGKKYQWIAFHETLGRVADNFVFRGTWRNDFPPYQGTWQMWERDIDPSCLLRKTPTDSTQKKPWWVSPVYKDWKPSIFHTNWTKIKDDLPNQKRLIEVKAQGGWLVLDGYIQWKQPPIPGEDEYDKVRREVWYILRSYIVKKDEADRMFSWAKKQNFMGRWMPDPLELRSTFLKEIPNSTAYYTEYNPDNKKRWVKIEDKERKTTNFQVMRTTEEYNWEGRGFDCSLDEGLNIHLVAKEIVKGMALKPSKESGKYIDKNGVVVAQDPSVSNTGSGVLLVKKDAILPFLKKNGYEIIWAVIGEKLLLGTMGGGEGFPGRLEMGGAHRMKSSGKLESKTYTKVIPPHKR